MFILKVVVMLGIIHLIVNSRRNTARVYTNKKPTSPPPIRRTRMVMHCSICDKPTGLPGVANNDHCMRCGKPVPTYSKEV